MGRKLASIDLGTHTARLLIAEWDEDSRSILPVARRRTYVHLGSAFQQDTGNTGFLSSAVVPGVVEALHEFKRHIHDYGVKTTLAVATGVIRQAKNGEEILRLLREDTGIDITVVSGEKEAQLTAAGVHHAIDLGKKAHVVVDLGGGSTEFLVAQNDQWWVRSLTIGASVLSESYLKSDPPGRSEIKSLSVFIRETLGKGLDRMPFPRVFLLVGSGGTIVTLGSLIHHVPMSELIPDRINGLSLTRDAVQRLFSEMSSLNLEKRIKRYAVDEGRARVFPAGVLLAIEIMRFLSRDRLTVCFSDLLEGLLWHYLEEKKI